MELEKQGQSTETVKQQKCLEWLSSKTWKATENPHFPVHLSSARICSTWKATPPVAVSTEAAQPGPRYCYQPKQHPWMTQLSLPVSLTRHTDPHKPTRRPSHTNLQTPSTAQTEYLLLRDSFEHCSVLISAIP